ncbi:MAG TPA: glycogen debranching N-terminal domain-containing protein [Ktedonobacterales bacterium]|nr:glycogen debranching N-terminal domain-containing protein [Ktedonobacterales bacterium]
MDHNDHQTQVGHGIGESIRVAQTNMTLHSGSLACACGRDGRLHADQQHGLFAGDTRVLSTYHFGIGGSVWRLLSRSDSDSRHCDWMYQNNRFRDAIGEVPAGTLHLHLSRRIEEDALRDEMSLQSYADRCLYVRFTLLLDADFADIFEVHSQSIAPRLSAQRDTSHGQLHLRYEREGFARGIRITFEPSSGSPVFIGAYVFFQLELPQGAEWRCRISALPEVGHDLLLASEKLAEAASIPMPDSSTLSLASDAILQRPFDRGRSDVRALAIPQPGHAPFVAAGAPWFMTLFGRDVLVTSLMAGLDGGWLARGALFATGQYQATIRDDFRDAEPGKFPHELRRGELAYRREIPQSPMYYGTHDAPALYCLALWNAWRWTGDHALINDHLAAARAALRWCDELGDRDGDGLLEYATRSSKGYRNQSWKDAGDAIVHADGSQPTLPLATVELQGYLFAARLAMAELLTEAGDLDAAQRARESAFALRRIVEERYWLPDQGFYAMALDGQKRQVAGIGSNPGHLLWCGLPSRDRAQMLAERFLRPDLFSGWGLRTLSSDNPAYNPLSYQRGSVWPHDTALLAAGLFRYGRPEDTSAFLRVLLEAACVFEEGRLPELFCGFDRTHGLPVPYEQANSPQAWAAAAPLLAAQLFLGALPDAPRRRCFIVPWLPDWLPRVALRGVSIGQGSFDITISRQGAVTTVEELDCRDIEVYQSTTPAPLWGEPFE